MDRATQRVLGFTCLLIVTQACPETAAVAEEPTLRTGDLVVVVFENGTSWSAGHATRLPAIVTAVDAKGTISINSNRTTYKDGWLRQQSLSGTIRAESVKPGKLIASDEVASLKLATIETHTLQLPDHL